MTNNRNNYWYMRLRNRFFDDKELVEIESLPESKYGLNFAYLTEILYLKMICYSVDSDGFLLFCIENEQNSDIAYSLCRRFFPMEKLDQVKQALMKLEEFGLVEIMQDVEKSVLFLPVVPNNTGKSTEKADEKRALRRMKKNAELPETTSDNDLILCGVMKNIYLTRSEYRELENNYQSFSSVLDRLSWLSVGKSKDESSYTELKQLLEGGDDNGQDNI